MADDVTRMLATLRRERAQIDATIRDFERLAGIRGSRRGPLPALVKELRKKARSSGGATGEHGGGTSTPIHRGPGLVRSRRTPANPDSQGVNSADAKQIIASLRSERAKMEEILLNLERLAAARRDRRRRPTMPFKLPLPE
jgi:hypothetical protein